MSDDNDDHWMICTCRAEGLRAVVDRRLRIYERMGLNEMDDLTTAIVLSLGFDFRATDFSIGADMWFGVSIATPLTEKDLYIQCDWPTDGLAWIWEKLAEKFPERVSVNPARSEMASRVTKRVSEMLSDSYSSASSLYRSHRAQAHKDDNDCPPCEDCDVYMTLYTTYHHTLDEVWGARVIEDEVKKAWD